MKNIDTKTEKLYNAIGLLSDEKIKQVDDMIQSQQEINRTRPLAFQFIPMAAGAVILAIGAVIMLYALKPDDVISPYALDTTVPQQTYDPSLFSSHKDGS